MVNSSAGRRGSRRRQLSRRWNSCDRGALARRPGRDVPSAPSVRSRRLRPHPPWVTWCQARRYQDWPATSEAMSWQAARASSTSTCCRRSPPRTAPCSGCRRPGTRAHPRTAHRAGPGVAVVPGLLIGAACMACERLSREGGGSLLVLGVRRRATGGCRAARLPSHRAGSHRPATR